MVLGSLLVFILCFYNDCEEEEVENSCGNGEEEQVQTSCDNGEEVPIVMARRCPKENKKYFSSH
jgi:hypothetical protein